jgi:hypothetical protein
MSRYVDHPEPEALYLWNTHLTKTYLADIEHLEVLLRNCIHAALASRYGERWFDNDRINFSDEAKRAFARRRDELEGEETSTPVHPQQVAIVTVIPLFQIPVLGIRKRRALVIGQ